MHLKIRTKLALAVSLLFALLIAVFAVFTRDHFETTLRDELFRQQFAMLSASAEELDNRLESSHTVLMAAAGSLPQHLIADPDRLQTWLDGRAELHKVFDNHIFLISPEGRIVVESPFLPKRRGLDVTHREYFRQTMAEGGRAYISDPFISSQPHKHPSIMMTVPVRDEAGKLLGLLTGSLDLTRDNFLGKLSHRRVGETGYLFLVTAKRVMIMHPDPKRIFTEQPPGASPALERAFEGFEGTAETVNSYGRTMFASFKRLTNKDWILAAAYPKDEALASLHRFQRILAGATVFGILLTALLVWLLMRRQLSPLTAFAGHLTALPEKKGADRLAAVTGDDEIAVMTGKFNDLIRALDRQQEALAKSEELHRTLSRFGVDLVFWRRPDGTMAYVSENAELLTGYPAEAFYADPGLLDALVVEEDRERWRRHTHVLGDDGMPLPLDLRIRNRNGDVRWISHRCQTIVGPGGEVLGMRGSHRDITSRRRDEDHLRLAGAVFEAAREAIVVTDTEARIIAVNPAFTAVTGYTEEEVVGQNPRLLQSGRQEPEFYANLWQTLLQYGHWQGEFWNRRKNGEIFPALANISAVRDDTGQVTRFVGIQSDISALKEAEERVAHLAYHDSLTGLANRRSLEERANLALALAERRHEPAAILFLDLDRFKEVNDSLGHTAGDAVLVQAAERLLSLTRDADTVTRLGGDEFVLLLPSEGREGALRVATKILAEIRRPFAVEGHQLTLSTSVGIALFPHDGDDFGELLKNADTALYRAKQEGRNTAVFYDREMNLATFERLILESELRKAIEGGQLITYYQPKLRLSDGAPIGAEALVRWQHPEQGLVPPGRFIPVAEMSGLINELGDWVLADVCRQLAEWKRQGMPTPRVAVNLAARHFRTPDLPGRISSLLAAHGLPATALELELTESTLLDAGEQVLENLRALKHLGVGLAIDDFGTGYSSLSYLKRMPITVLKIDQSFVRGLERDPDDRILSTSIVALGHSMGLKVVAEGVETEEQYRILLEQGCDYGQGYLFARPLPAAEFTAWWQRQSR